MDDSQFKQLLQVNVLTLAALNSLLRLHLRKEEPTQLTLAGIKSLSEMIMDVLKETSGRPRSPMDTPMDDWGFSQQQLRELLDEYLDGMNSTE